VAAFLLLSHQSTMRRTTTKSIAVVLLLSILSTADIAVLVQAQHPHPQNDHHHLFNDGALHNHNPASPTHLKGQHSLVVDGERCDDGADCTSSAASASIGRNETDTLPVLHASRTSSATSHRQQQNATESLSSLCPRLYLHQSTLPNAGLGVFTAVDVKEGDIVEELVLSKSKHSNKHNNNNIPVVYALDVATLSHSTALLWRNYTWAGDLFGGKVGGDAFVPGLASMVNSNTEGNGNNVKPIFYVDNVDGSGSGRHILQIKATRNIPAGSELFTHYGDHWFPARQQWRDEHKGADTVAEGEQNQVNVDHEKDKDGVDQLVRKAQRLGVLDLVRDWKLFDETNTDHHSWEQKVLLSVQKLNGKEGTAQDARQKKRNEFCHDGATTGNAGSVVATRDFSTGDIVTSSVLLHGDTTLPSNLQEAHCYGHPESTLRLCPIAANIPTTGHIDDTTTGLVPNVQVQWADHGNLHMNAYLMSMPVEAVLANTDPALAVHYVAIRPIRQGEALVLLEQRDSTTTPTARNFADQLNRQELFSNLILRTVTEQLDNPYPTTVRMQCHSSILTHDSSEGLADWDDDDAIDCDLDDRYVDPVDGYITYAVHVHGYHVGGVPRQSIRFADVPTDTRSLSFADAWKNKKTALLSAA
jgi:hypothetical protein